MSVGDGHRYKSTADPDLIVALCAAVRALSETTDDPHLLIGALIEGAIYTVHRSIPAAEHVETAAAILQIIADRIDAYGLLEQSEGAGSMDRKWSD